MFGMLFASGKFQRNVLKPINLAIDHVSHSQMWVERDDELRLWVAGYVSGFVIYNHNKVIATEIYNDLGSLPNVWNAYRADVEKVFKLKFLQEDLNDFKRLFSQNAFTKPQCQDGFSYGFLDAEFWEQASQITTALANKVIQGDPLYVD